MQFRPLLWLPILLACQLVTGAQAQNAGGAAALSGQVSSTEEGAMEGVLVSARRDGSTITVTVVSDDKGRYSFPAERLEPGHYTISIRAVGYDLDGPEGRRRGGGRQRAPTSSSSRPRISPPALQRANG